MKLFSSNPSGTVRFLVLSVLVPAVIALAAQSVQARSTSDSIEYVLPRVVKIFGAGGLQKLASYGTGFLV
ncbi:MAG: serine protease, partial [Planctomycetaceae bacterium]